MPNPNRTTQDDLRNLSQSPIDTWIGLRIPASVSIKDYPYFAGSNDGQDDTDAFTAAIRDNPVVFIPPGQYKVTGLNIPRGRTLQFAEGAQLLLSGTITMNGNWGKILGPSYTMPVANGLAGWTPQIKWVGANTDNVFEIGYSIDAESFGAPIGITIKGIEMDAGTATDLRAFSIGADGAGASWLMIRDIFGANFKNGMEVRGGVQGTCQFRNIHFNNVNPTNWSTDIGLHVGTLPSGAVVAENIYDTWDIQGFATGVQCGVAGQTYGSVGHGVFRNFNMVGFDAAGKDMTPFKIHGNRGPILIEGCKAEIQTAAITGDLIPGVIVGDATAVPQNLTVRNCYFSGHVPMIKATQFNGLSVYDNVSDMSAYPVANVRAVEIIAGTTQRGGCYFDNHVAHSLTSTEFFGSQAGFHYIHMENRDGTDQSRHTRVRLGAFSLTSTTAAPKKLFEEAFEGFALIEAKNGPYCAMFFFTGTNHRTIKIFDPDSNFDVVKDTVNRYNIYWDAVNTRYSIQDTASNGSYPVTVTPIDTF